MMGCTFATKKELKGAKGECIRDFIQETSIFGKEYKPNLEGVPVVGPDAYTKRKWFAQIWIKDDILIKVT